MKLLRTLLTIAVVLGALAVGVLFAIQNKEPVPLNLLVYAFEPRSLALWLFAALALGGMSGMLISSAIVIRLRTSLGSAQRQLSRARSEVDTLRTAGLKDSE
jgi:putative membrane protein